MYLTTHALTVHFSLHENSSLKPAGSCIEKYFKHKKPVIRRIKPDRVHSLKRVRFYISLRTDTHHTQSCVEQYRWWRGTTCGSSITEQRGKTGCFLIDCICTITVQFRHSPRSILFRTVSIISWHNNFSMKKIIYWRLLGISDDLYIYSHR
jgi:hypothetical protein